MVTPAHGSAPVSRRTTRALPPGASVIDSDDNEAHDARAKVAPQQQPAVPLRAALLSGGALWLLFVVVLDPQFAAYWLLANALVGLAAADRLARHSAEGRRAAGFALLAIAGSTTLLALLREFELNDLEHYDATPISLGAPGASGDDSNVHFLRLYNPQVGYSDDVETIHRAMNRKQVVEGEKKPTAKTATSEQTEAEEAKPRVQRYAVHPKINAWSSDVLRYNILLQFWSQTSARPAQDEEVDDPQLRLRRERADSQRMEILCVVESDVVFREAYFSDALRAYQEQREAAQQHLELAHIQHFWGHHTLEPFNIGVLCTSSRASLRTRLWVRLMRALHAKRYRRLLYLDFLYAFLPDRFVFSWDEHHGCTEYYPHCHYVHFTRPKGDGIRKAMSAVALGNKAAS